MSSAIDYALLVAGFVFLIKGADFLIDGSSGIARRLGVSDLIVGLTIVAFGTSAPELVVNIVASLEGKSDLAVGNVVGSNTANILLILGVSALVRPLSVQVSTIWKEIPFAFFSIVIVAILANDQLLEGATSDRISRANGYILLSFFTIFLVYIFGLAKAGTLELELEEGDGSADLPLWKIFLYLALGFAGILVGGNWIIRGAVTMGRDLGVSEAFIGLTVLALGTSLPELAASAMAAARGKVDLAIGNVVGSNIFNVFLVLGASASINNIDFNPARNLDLGVSGAAALILMFFVFFPEKRKLGRIPGVIFLAAYISYMIFVVGRG